MDQSNESIPLLQFQKERNLLLTVLTKCLVSFFENNIKWPYFECIFVTCIIIPKTEHSQEYNFISLMNKNGFLTRYLFSSCVCRLLFKLQEKTRSLTYSNRSIVVSIAPWKGICVKRQIKIVCSKVAALIKNSWIQSQLFFEQLFPLGS